MNQYSTAKIGCKNKFRNNRRNGRIRHIVAEDGKDDGGQFAPDMARGDHVGLALGVLFH